MAHMHYTGTGKMHSFRGLLADAAQERIRIQGPVGSIAWRITKFQIIEKSPLDTSARWCVKIFRESQSSIDTQIDFRNDELLAVGVWSGQASAHNYPEDMNVIFDNALFSRNIHISAKAEAGSSCNYYIELEEVKLSAAGMAQLAVAAARRTID